MISESDIFDLYLRASKLAPGTDLDAATVQKKGVSIELPIGFISLLIVPEKNEIEVWIDAVSSASKLHVPLSTIQKAVGLKNGGIMFSDPSSFSLAANRALEILGEVIENCRADSTGFETRLREHYHDSIEKSRAARLLREANNLWESGEYSEAVALYRNLDSGSPLVRKRIYLFERAQH